MFGSGVEIQPRCYKIALGAGVVRRFSLTCPTTTS